MDKYIVIDNEMPAELKSHPIWKNSVFNQFDKAIDYANKWLGNYGPMPFDYQVNTKYDYSGYGDTIEIRKMQ